MVPRKKTAPAPLKRGLFVHRFLSNILLLGLNWLCRFKKKSNPIPSNPKRILLSNIANFGDVVISTTVLPLIKKKYPNCEIGFVTSSASSMVLKNHPLISKVHTFDHWYLHQCKAALHWWKSRRGILRELKEAQYDVAIDLYAYFPNTIPLLSASGIPVRIGYPTGGFSNLLTHPIPWDFAHCYAGIAHHHLLKPLGIDPDPARASPFYGQKKRGCSYLAVHMGSFHSVKEWEEEKWIALIKKLKADGYEIVLTGKGARETDRCLRVAQATGATSLSDKIDWFAFATIIQEARLVISIDSAAIHLAAAEGTPTIAIFTGINPLSMWAPPHCSVVVENVPCSPCFKKGGCTGMGCIRGVTVDRVYLEALQLLRASSRETVLQKGRDPIEEHDFLKY